MEVETSALGQRRGLVMSKFIPLSVPNLSGNELEYVTQVVKNEWVSTGGAEIEKFEKFFAQYVQKDIACAVQSGTAGLHLAMKLCGVGWGDEVIVPTLTFIAAVNPVKYCGAEPVFMDCDDYLCLDVDKVREFIETECLFNGEKLINKNTQKQIKAVVAVHVFGNMVKMQPLMELAKQYKLKVIEDATEALGTYQKETGLYAGTIGDFGVYSFNGNKIITTGGGGMLVAKNTDDTKHAKHLSTQAKADVLYFDHDEIGYNYRMTNLQAALGLAQFEQLEKFIEAKIDNYNYYVEKGLNLLPFDETLRSNHWFYSLISEDRDGLIKYLNDNQIQTRPIWKLIHTLKPYKDCQSYKIEKALKYYEKIVNIPCSTGITQEELLRVYQEIKEFNLG